MLCVYPLSNKSASADAESLCRPQTPSLASHYQPLHLPGMSETPLVIPSSKSGRPGHPRAEEPQASYLPRLEQAIVRSDPFWQLWATVGLSHQLEVVKGEGLGQETERRDSQLVAGSQASVVTRAGVGTASLGCKSSSAPWLQWPQATLSFHSSSRRQDLLSEAAALAPTLLLCPHFCAN